MKNAEGRDQACSQRFEDDIIGVCKVIKTAQVVPLTSRLMYRESLEIQTSSPVTQRLHANRNLVHSRNARLCLEPLYILLSFFW